MLTTYDKSDRFRLTNTLLDILHRLYVIKLGNYIQSYSITLVKAIKFIFNLYSNYINNKIYEKQKDSKIINS